MESYYIYWSTTLDFEFFFFLDLIEQKECEDDRGTSFIIAATVVGALLVLENFALIYLYCCKWTNAKDSQKQDVIKPNKEKNHVENAPKQMNIEDVTLQFENKHVWVIFRDVFRTLSDIHDTLLKSLYHLLFAT